MRRSLPGARRLSTAVAASASAPAEGRSYLVPGSVALSVVGAAAAGSTYVLTSRFVEDAEFRSWLRREQPAVSRMVEHQVLVDYAPAAWAQEVRIQDDGALADSEADAVAMGPVPAGATNVGVFSPAPSGMGSMGVLFFGRFAGHTPASTAPEPDRAPPTIPSTISSNLTTGPSGDAAQPTPLPSIAADEEGGDESDSGFDGDGVPWGSLSEPALMAAWKASAPPEMPTRLLVSVKAARRYEQALVAARVAASGAVGEDGAADADGSARLISMPLALQAELSEPSPSAGAEEQLLLLRVQEAYIGAEVEALEENVYLARKRAQACQGGGIALGRMDERCGAARRLEPGPVGLPRGLLSRHCAQVHHPMAPCGSRRLA